MANSYTDLENTQHPSETNCLQSDSAGKLRGLQVGDPLVRGRHQKGPLSLYRVGTLGSATQPLDTNSPELLSLSFRLPIFE